MEAIILWEKCGGLDIKSGGVLIHGGAVLIHLIMSPPSSSSLPSNCIEVKTRYRDVLKLN